MIKNSIILSYGVKNLKRLIAASYFIELFGRIGKWFNTLVNESYIYQHLIGEIKSNRQGSALGKDLVRFITFLTKSVHSLWNRAEETSLVVQWINHNALSVRKNKLGALRVFLICFALTYGLLKLLMVGFYIRLLLVVGGVLIGSAATLWLKNENIYKNSKTIKGLMEFKKCLIWSDLHE